MGEFKFTDTAIRKLPPPPKRPKGAKGPKDYFRFDSETSHFAIRVALKSKTFYFQNRDKEGTFRKKLGNFPGLTTKAAREIVKALTGDVARGVDLRAVEARKKVKEATPAVAPDALTLGQLLESWASTPSKDRRQSYTETTVVDLKRAFGPRRLPTDPPVVDLLELPIDPVVNAKIREQIEGSLEALADRPAARRVAAQKLRSLCRWGVKRRKISADPTDGIDLGEKSKSRKIFLTGDEARLVWQAAGTMPAPYGQAVRYLLISGLRLREAIESLWTEFNPDYSEQSIPGERMKEGEQHAVWLPLTARQMLRELPRYANCNFVFTRDGKGPIGGFSNLKRQLDKALVALAGSLGESIAKKSRFHDFRRSVTTWLVRNGRHLGIDSVVADRLLAHTQLTKISAVASTYNIYDFETERRAALELWVDFLEGGEAAAIPGPIPQLALSAPDPAPLDGTVLPSVSDSLAALEAYYGGEGLTSGKVLTQYLPARPEQRDQQAERLQRRMIDILLDPRVMRANLEMLKETLSAEFKSEHPNNPYTEAGRFMAHCAAQWAIDKQTVRTTEEIEAGRDSWKETIQRAKDDAKAARLAAEQARKLHQPEYAKGHEADALRLDAEAEVAKMFLQNAMTLDDPRHVGHRRGDPSYPSARAKALVLSLTKVTAKLFIRSHPTWAAAYAAAATGVAVTRDQARPRRKSRRVS